MDDRDAVKAHLVHLRLTGQSPGSVYARQRFLARLEAWLACYGDGYSGPGCSGERNARTDPEEAAPPGPALLDATPEDLARWRAALPARLEPHTIRGYVSHARGFYRWAVDEQLVAVNPASRLPVPRKARHLPRPIGEDDLMAAVLKAPGRVRPWLVLAGWAGLRALEISRLRRECVLDTLPEPLLLISAESTKGGRQERIVPMSSFVLAELRAYGLPASGYIFRRLDGHPGPNAASMVSHLSNEALASSGTAATLHQLRHRFASQLYIQTHDLRLVQELLGHRDPATTAGYAAYDRAGAATAVATLAVPQRMRLIKDTA